MDDDTLRRRLRPRRRCQPRDALEELLARLFALRTNGELQIDLVGDHVVLEPAVDRAHGDDARVER